jgi:hypothetical protein
MTATKYETLGEVTRGRLQLRDRAAFEAAVKTWPDGLVWASFELATVLRTPAQNRYWHSAIVKPFAAQCGVGPRQMHEALTVYLLPETVALRAANGHVFETVVIGGQTSRLSRAEAASLIDRATDLADALGVPRATVTHWIPWDSPQLGRDQRAFCGALVPSSAHADEPTCDQCAAALREREAMSP